MKPFAAFTLALPAALVAQAPAQPTMAQTIGQRQKAAAAEADRLLKAFQYLEAVAKAEEFAKTPQLPLPKIEVADLVAKPTLVKDHVEKAIGAVEANIHVLNGQVVYATTLQNAGQWEKAIDVLSQAVASHKQMKESYAACLQPIVGMWEKLDADAQAFLKENQGKAEAENKALMEEKTRLEGLWAEYNGQKRKFKKEEKAKLDEDTAKFDPRAKACGALLAEIERHKGNMGRVDAIKNHVAAQVKDVEPAGTILLKNLNDSKSKLEVQGKEIADFNAKLIAKKKKAEGPKPYVAGVLAERGNFVGKSANDQMFLLNRLAVLDPENQKVSAARENVMAGRDVNYVAPKAKGGKGKK